MKSLITLLLFCVSFAFGQEQKKEVFIIGTMHTVPKIVKNSYKLLLRMALKYKPEAIYVEIPMPNDSMSWEYLKAGWSEAYKKFYYLSDSLKRNYRMAKNIITQVNENSSLKNIIIIGAGHVIGLKAAIEQ